MRVITVLEPVLIKVSGNTVKVCSLTWQRMMKINVAFSLHTQVDYNYFNAFATSIFHI